MATTTNYGWTTPDDTALVKDGASAIRSLGTSVDTTTKALNPSTTLGDIEYRSSTANTNTRLAIGSTGNVLTVAGGVPTWAAPAGGFNAKANYVTTDQGTSSTSFTDLSTTQSVTLTTGTKALIILSAIMYKNNAASCWISFGVTGATTLAAADARSIINYTNESDVSKGISGSFYVDTLTAGSNTFTMKFKVNSGTGNWYNRNIAVIDMGS